MPREYLPTRYKKKPKNKKVPKKTRDYVKKTIMTLAEKKAKTAGVELFAGSSGVVTRLTGIAQGDGPDQRDGNAVRLQHLKCRLQVDIADAPINVCRVIFFKWHDVSTPATVDLLNITAIPTLEHLAQYNYFTRTMYTILSDRTFTLDTDDPTRTYQYNKYFKGSGLRIDYDGTGITSIAVKNDIYMLFISDSGIIPNPSVKLSYQLLYTDI